MREATDRRVQPDRPATVHRLPDEPTEPVDRWERFALLCAVFALTVVGLLAVGTVARLLGG